MATRNWNPIARDPLHNDALIGLSWKAQGVMWRICMAVDGWGRMLGGRMDFIRATGIADDATDAINELAAADLITVYGAGGGVFIAIVGHEDMLTSRQKKSFSGSKIPAPITGHTIGAYGQGTVHTTGHTIGENDKSTEHYTGQSTVHTESAQPSETTTSVHYSSNARPSSLSSLIDCSAEQHPDTVDIAAGYSTGTAKQDEKAAPPPPKAKEPTWAGSERRLIAELEGKPLAEVEIPKGLPANLEPVYQEFMDELVRRRTDSPMRHPGRRSAGFFGAGSQDDVRAAFEHMARRAPLVVEHETAKFWTWYDADKKPGRYPRPDRVGDQLERFFVAHGAPTLAQWQAAQMGWGE